MKKTYFLIFVITPLMGIAQSKLAEANRMVERLSYYDAIPRYETILKTDTSLLEAKVKLADCYRLTGNYKKAEDEYASVVKNSNTEKINYFHYAQMLMNNGKYSEARKWMKKYEEALPEDDRGKKFVKSIDAYTSFFLDSSNYTLTNLVVNNEGNDFSPAYYKAGIVYSASQANARGSNRHSWTGQSYTRLYYVDSASSNTSKEFASKLQISMNNGPASFNEAGDEIFLTVNFLKLPDAKKGTHKLSIISSHYDKEKKAWSPKENFKYNSVSYNVAHPTLSPDGATLYFSSDMPGGEGSMDIYKCKRENGGWGQAENLGRPINTAGSEVFPFIHSDGTLYFASNGHEGIGGLDIYSTTQQNNTWSIPTNLGAPVNSRRDDFGFIVNNTKENGYFSSNREQGKGGDDIYHFELKTQTIKGFILDATTNTPITKASIILLDANTGDTLKALTSNDAGLFSFPSPPCKNYKIVATHSDYPGGKTENFQSACGAAPEKDLKLLLAKSLLQVTVLDKYTNQPIQNTSVQLYDLETTKLVYQAPAENFKCSVKPCHDYKLLASKEGMPDASLPFKTACTATNETASITMGLPPPDPNFYSGIVYEQGTTMGLDSTTAIIYDKNKKAISSIATYSDGRFSFSGLGRVEQLVFFRRGYFSLTKNLSDEKNIKDMVLEMPRLQLDKVIKLEGIFYDLGKFAIRPDAASVLDNVVKVMQENPTLQIELTAHTDARGSDQSNLSLSDKRAKAAAAYIVSKGISQERIVGKGYGESVLKNGCGNGVKCTEVQHQENRRTEVKITKY